MTLWKPLFARLSPFLLPVRRLRSFLRALLFGKLDTPLGSKDQDSVLKLLWKDDPGSRRVVSVLLKDQQCRAEVELLEMLARHVRKNTLGLPSAPEKRRQAVVAALAECLRNYVAGSISIRSKLTTTPMFSSVLQMILWLNATELHADCCDLLEWLEMEVRSAAAIVSAHRGDENFEFQSRVEDEHKQTLEKCLASFPPDAIPIFWERLRDESKTSVFLSVLMHMTDSRAVPFLLETLPMVASDGKCRIIYVLGNIGDIRAVPTLQRIVTEEHGRPVILAARAVEHILRHSKDDSAQLLRASNTNHSPESLLRAAASVPDITPSDELLRPE